jgi:hypothetical protein
MPKNTKTSLEQVRAISRMLTQKVDTSIIAKEIKRSKTTVEKVRAHYRAITLDEALSHIEKRDYLPDIEYHDAEERARRISAEVRTAIIKGMADAIHLKDIVDPVPLDPRLAFAPQQVESEHQPPLSLAPHPKRGKLR